jgi:protein-tyrosine-phosphatase/predicted ATP-grasp superfamily ATP-dependent carboligase
VSRPPARSGRVLVLGQDNRSFLSVVRSLGRKGLEVHVAWCPSHSSALRSRYVARVHRLPAYDPVDATWKERFIALCDAQRFDLVLPTNDPSIIPLHLNRVELEPHARLYLPSPEVFEIAFDKHRSRALAVSLGLPVPREERFACPVAAADVLARFHCPLAVKPLASFRVDDVRRKHQVRLVFETSELEPALRAFDGDDEVLVQDFFAGSGVGIEMLVDRGEVLVAYQHIRLHEPRRGGNSSFRKSVAPWPELRAAAADVMRALAYTGVGMVEFRVDLATRRWIFLEINGRFWGSLPLAVAAGADFPWWLYQLVVEGRRDFPTGYRTELYGRNWLNEIDWLAQNLRGPRAERYTLVQAARELTPMLRGSHRNDTLVIDDPGPGLYELRRLAGRLVGAAGRVARSAGNRLPLVRRLRAARAQRALRSARTVLFVCKGNICRSPFAQAYAQATIANGGRVLSSGYHPREGRPCPPEAVAAARELGFDLALHRSTVLSEDVVRRAEAIFVFDEENWRTLLAAYPFARRKLHRVGELSPAGPLDIRDPYGGSLEDFRTAYGAIRRTLDACRAP